MGTKGIPFGYLEFSHAIGGTMPTRARTVARVACPSGVDAVTGAEARARVRVWAWNPTRPGSFSTGPHGFGIQAGLDPLCYPQTRSTTRQLRCNGWKEPLQRFLSETNNCNGSDRTVATAQTPNDEFALQRTPRSAVNSALLSVILKTQKSFPPLFLYTEN